MPEHELTHNAGHVLARAGSAHPPVHAPAPEPQLSAATITDFLTDGSLAALCQQLQTFSGLRVELQDPAGHVITRVEHPSTGPTWVRSSDTSDLAGEGVMRFGITLGQGEIGAIVLGPGKPNPGKEARSRLENTLRLIASATAEICRHDLEIRYRIKEVGALSRMGTLLGRAASPQKVLDVTIDQSLDVLRLDAGSIMLLKERSDGTLSEDEADLAVAVSRNLSQEWLDLPSPLSKNRVFDKLAMGGQVVTSEDIAQDDRIFIPERAAEEGLGAALHAGLIFKDRPLGVIRLYSRTPRVFDEAEKKLLASLASQAAAALEQSRLLTLEQEERRMQQQLSLAADVQRRMLPKGVPNFPRLDVAARYVPSFELGGDFYDFIDLSGHLGIVVGDVVGKGVAAALLMSSVRASLRAYAQDVYDLDDIVARVNQALCRDTREHEFASLWYGVIDPHKLTLTYCSAGHEPPVVVRVPKHRAPTPADVDELPVGGMVVGIDPSQRYQRSQYDLRPDDVLLAYTDGLTDATNFAGERFGKVRVRETLLRTMTEKPNASAGDIVQRMLWEVRQFVGLSKARTDDITLVAMRVR